MDCTNPNNHPSTEPEETGFPQVQIGTTIVDVVPGSSAFCSLAASFTDEEFDLCGVGTKILRTWTIFDWCTPIGPGNPWSCIQVIQFEDRTAPTILGGCGDPISVNTDAHDCEANVNLPSIRTRDCSAVTVAINSPFGVVNSNGGILSNVPFGTHNVTFIATDDCGNASSCTRIVTVEDLVPPVAVCDEFTVVSLTSDGTGIANASTFDDGSSDNCGLGMMQVRRMPDNCQDTTFFDSFATFECCDLGDTVSVMFRVFDLSGNFNECMVDVWVQDKLPPTITCPTGKTVDCSLDLLDLTIFGNATAEDNCETLDITVEETRNVDNCGVGFIEREFTAADNNGRTASCVQIITVQNNDLFTIDDIEWPLDYTTSECGASLDPDDIPCDSVRFCEPGLADSGCGLLAITFTDQELPVNNACTKVLRTWIVIDWCQFDPNGATNAGFWQFTQTLKVNDLDAPILSCPMDTILVENKTQFCNDADAIIPPISATDCSNDLDFEIRIDLGNDGTVDNIISGNDASGEYLSLIHI